MKYFGQFLVSKGVINENQLVSTLVEQLRSLPSYIELAHEMELLPAAQILRVIEIQQTEGLDFKQSCQKLGIWNDHIHEKIEEKLSQLRIPMGQILLKNSFLDRPNLTKLLDEFFSQIVEAPLSTINSSTSNVRISENETIQSSVHSEFLQFLSDSRLNNIVGLSTLLDGQNDLDMIRPVLKELVIEIHSLKGVASLDKLSKTSELIHRLELKVTLAIAGLKQGSNDGLRNLSGAIVVFVKALDLIRKGLNNNFDETKLWSDPDISHLVASLNQ